MTSSRKPLFIPGMASDVSAEKSDPKETLSRKSLLIPGVASDVPTLKSVFLPSSLSKDKHANMERQSTILIEKPLPSSPVEARPMSPSRDQEGEFTMEVEVPIPCKLPYQRAADIDGEYISVTGIDGDRVYAAKVGPVKASYNASAVHSKGVLPLLLTLAHV